MENWSYRIKEFWLLNKREIKRYGLCALLVSAGMLRSSLPVALIGLGAALVMWTYDRWGQPWAERGRFAMKSGSTNKLS